MQARIDRQKVILKVCQSAPCDVRAKMTSLNAISSKGNKSSSCSLHSLPKLDLWAPSLERGGSEGCFVLNNLLIGGFDSTFLGFYSN